MCVIQIEWQICRKQIQQKRKTWKQNPFGELFRKRTMFAIRSQGRKNTSIDAEESKWEVKEILSLKCQITKEPLYLLLFVWTFFFEKLSYREMVLPLFV